MAYKKSSTCSTLLLFITFGFHFTWSRVKQDKGMFFLNGIFPITHRDGRINYQSGVMLAEAMKYAVNRINNQSDFMYGYKLGIKRIFDLREDRRVSDAILSTFVADIPFLIGPYSSETSYITSILTGTFRQVVVSYGATYSDFDKSGIDKTYMVRSVPSNRFRVEAMLEFLRYLEWNYVAVINSYGYNGERDARFFISKLPTINVCLADQVDLIRQPTQNTYHEAIWNLHFDKRLKAILLFTTNKDSRQILQAIQNLDLQERFYLVCAYGCTNYVEVTQGLEEVAAGTLSLDLHSPEIEDFKEYFLRQNPSTNRSPYFLQFWSNLFNCSVVSNANDDLKPCNGNEKLSVGRGYYPISPVHTVIDAVTAVATAIKLLLEHFCYTGSKGDSMKPCAINASDRKIYSHTSFLMLRNISYIDGTLDTTQLGQKKANRSVRYDIHNFRSVSSTYKNVYVGKWEINRSHNFKYAEEVLAKETSVLKVFHSLISVHGGKKEFRELAVCSRRCPPTYRQVKNLNVLKAQCCWTCRECPEHNIAVNYTCIRCKHTEIANKQTNVCEALPQYHLDYTHHFSAIVIFFSVVGLLSTSVVCFIFIYHNQHNVVRASGRDLCHVMLFGISLVFICPISYLVKPSNLFCIFRGTLPGLGFLICYAPLFLKTNRIYRIFQNAKKSVTRPNLVSSKSQLLLLCGIVAVQVLLATVWYASKLPEPNEVVSKNGKYITLHCKGDSSPILMLLNLALSVKFMISCTVFAFKTRHFPKNYNEAKYIGITLYVTCVAWAVLLPAYFLATGVEHFVKEYLMCAICLIIGSITLCGLFGQKVKMILCSKPPDSCPQMLSTSQVKTLYVQTEGSSSHQDLRSLTEEPPMTPPLRLVGVLKNGNTAHLKTKL